VQKSRSSMRSTARRNNVNVVVRAEAQKTIDMNEVSFTLIDSLVFVCAFVSSLSLYSGMEKGSIFLLLLCLLLDPEIASSADGTKDIVVKMDKISSDNRDYSFIDARVKMFC
jgi:hypothetical protein